jgi:hypothetical protein
VCAAGKVVPCNYYADGTYKNQKPIKPKPKTTLTREARIDNVENISVVLLVVVAVVDLNRFRSNAQKRLTKDCSGDQIRCAPLGVDGGSKGASRVEWLVIGEKILRRRGCDTQRNPWKIAASVYRRTGLRRGRRINLI